MTNADDIFIGDFGNYIRKRETQPSWQLER
jgi:hypothetical protein